MPFISPRFLSASIASTAALPRFILSETFFSAWRELYSASILRYAASSSDSCFSSSDSLRLASRILLPKSSVLGPASAFSCSMLHLASLISKSMVWSLSSRFAKAVCASSEAASALASLPWVDLSSAEQASKSVSTLSSSFWSSFCSPPVSAMASEISDSSLRAASILDSSSACLDTRSSRFCLRVTTIALFLAMESSKFVLNPDCSSRSISAASFLSFFVARSTLAASIFSLSSLYSGPILEAISSSFADIS